MPVLNLNELDRWPVIACDQFTSEPQYWQYVKNLVQNSPSAYNLIFPEAELNNDPDLNQKRISQINECMKMYLEQKIFHEFKNSYIYIERELLNHKIRRGILGTIDLEEYDYRPASKSQIRSTELTVQERIPPRKKIREGAVLELSHVILLCDDVEKNLIEPLTLEKNQLKKLYDVNLMLGGGNIKAWLVDGEHAEKFNQRMQNYIDAKKSSGGLVFAVGDGNHSLAAAKSCYDDDKNNLLARYASVELENLHDDAILFEPIHRLVKNIEPENLLNAVKEICTDDLNNSWPVKFYSQGNALTLNINKNSGASALHVIQKFLDDNKYEIDYIHDEDTLKNLANKNNCAGFEMPPFDENAKRGFFDLIAKSGNLPRKTFSMGHAQEKRYYFEARRIK